MAFTECQMHFCLGHCVLQMHVQTAMIAQSHVLTCTQCYVSGFALLLLGIIGMEHWQSNALIVHRMVHDDVYKIIKYTVQKTMTGELAQRALDWWAGLVEHLFGLPQRTPEQEKAVVPAAEDHSTRNKVIHKLTRDCFV